MLDVFLKLIVLTLFGWISGLDYGPIRHVLRMCWEERRPCHNQQNAPPPPSRIGLSHFVRMRSRANCATPKSKHN